VVKEAKFRCVNTRIGSWRLLGRVVVADHGEILFNPRLDERVIEQTKTVCKYGEKVVEVLGWRECDSQDYSNHWQRKNDQTQKKILLDLSR